MAAHFTALAWVGSQSGRARWTDCWNWWLEWLLARWPETDCWNYWPGVSRLTVETIGQVSLDWLLKLPSAVSSPSIQPSGHRWQGGVRVNGNNSLDFCQNRPCYVQPHKQQTNFQTSAAKSLKGLPKFAQVIARWNFMGICFWLRSKFLKFWNCHIKLGKLSL